MGIFKGSSSDAAISAAPPRRRGFSGYPESLLLVGAATAIGIPLADRMGTSAVDLLYLVPVMAAASLFGIRQGLFASVASALAYNFFFTEPVHTFRIDDPANIVTVFLLFAVASVTSQLASRMRAQADAAERNAGVNAILAGFARQLIACATEKEVGDVTCREVARLFAVNAIFLSRTGGDLALLASEPETDRLSAIDRAAALAAVEEKRTCGRGTGRFNAADWTFYPVLSKGSALAVLGLARDDGSEPVGPERLSLLTSLLDQTALAVERARLESEMLGVAQLRERDRLRGALLSSVGHDLRTPLTAILASAAELRRRGSGADAELAATVEGEARRLDRMIGNLLDMARVEAGAIKLNLDAVDLTEAVASAARDVRPSLSGRAFSIDVPPDLPLVRVDPQLLHHCLINLLDNAGRHSTPGSPITVSARLADHGVDLSVLDEGAGIPEGREDEIFDTFTHIEGSDRKGGTGLGLAIVKGFAEAMNLQVQAGNRDDTRGAKLTLHFPERTLVAAA